MQNNESKASIWNFFSELFESVKGYVQTYIDLLKLDIFEAVTRVFSSLVFIIAALFTLFFAIIILEIALAMYLGEQNGHLWVGLLWVGLGNLLIVPILYIIHIKGGFHSIVKQIIHNALINDHHSADR